jgi:hypothetical protein
MTKAKAAKGKAGAKSRKPQAKGTRTTKASVAPAAFVTTMPALEGNGETSRDRDELGRFVMGSNGGPGRPPGSRNKLTEDFIQDFHAAWRQHGATALEAMATGEPSTFVRAAVQLMPKDVLLDARGAGLIVVRLDDVDMNL